MERSHIRSAYKWVHNDIKSKKEIHREREPDVLPVRRMKPLENVLIRSFSSYQCNSHGSLHMIVILWGQGEGRKYAAETRFALILPCERHRE